MTLDLNRIRQEFPALQRPAIYLDNPGGTQVARTSLERINRYLIDTNANHGGLFSTSRASDAIVDETRAAMADFLNAARPEEIILGPNMTTLTFRLSHALAKRIHAGDTIVITNLDHDANISPWLHLAADTGCRVRRVDFDPATGKLDLEDFKAAMTEKPVLVAFGYASNALGTVNPAAELTALAKAAGALVYIDAVQFAPHGPIDVQALGCDFLVCSAYKFFGPHVGILYGKHDLLEELYAYRVRPAPADAPGKFETGTNNFEGIAGTLGALEHFEWLGQTFGAEHLELYSGQYAGRRLVYKQAMSALRAYEHELSRALIEVIQELPGATIYGPTDLRNLDERVPTVSFTLQSRTPAEVAIHLGEHEIYVWNGNFYALAVTTRLGLEGRGGLIRVGATHYNTLEEIERFGAAMRELF